MFVKSKQIAMMNGSVRTQSGEVQATDTIVERAIVLSLNSRLSASTFVHWAFPHVSLPFTASRIIKLDSTTNTKLKFLKIPEPESKPNPEANLWIPHRLQGRLAPTP